MHGLIWFGRGLASNRNRLALTAVAALGMALSSSLLAQDPMPIPDPEPTAVPAIVNFKVDWEEVDPVENTYKFTFSGSLRNCENLEGVVVRLLGYPFDALVAPSDGSFSIEFVENGDIGFGRMITGVILSNGAEVSATEVTGT